ncbi:MAG: sodium:proton antiporter [Rikenellaceae bacterium]
MKKVLSFSLFLLVGLVASQLLPDFMGESFTAIKSYALTPLLYICLAFIMINVGREFEVDKAHWRSYTQDYFIAMATAALPWLLVALYYVFVLLPPHLWGSGAIWRETLLLSRFAAPTSAGILFAMLATLNLKSSWIYKKIQVLAIFDDLDTIILMIPLQIMMIGMQWQLFVVVFIVVVLLALGWRKLDCYNVRQDWKAILFYAVVVFGITHALYHVSESLIPGEHNGIHIEVLLPAFVVGMIIKHNPVHSLSEERVENSISYLFMLLVGLSMPLVVGAHAHSHPETESVISLAVPTMHWHVIALHVLSVTLLSNIGKLMPLFFYRDRRLSERLAVSVGMFTRGEVGAGVIFIAISYGLGGTALIVSALTLVLNLVLTGVFVVWVKVLAQRSYLKKDA